MSKQHLYKAILFSFGIFCLGSSCVSVKAYEKMYLNDTDMKLGARKVDLYQQNFHAYREGASGANGGKSGGGCGCN